MAWAVSRLSQQPPQPWLEAFLQALQADEALVRKPVLLALFRFDPEHVHALLSASSHVAPGGCFLHLLAAAGIC
jgi:hypothetical protein